MRIAEAFLEGKNRATCSQKSGQRPVHQAQVLIANESVKYQRNVGAPHEHNDALEVEFETEGMGPRAVAQENMVEDGEGKTCGRAEEPKTTDDLVHGCGDGISGRDLGAEDIDGRHEEEQGADEMGEDVDCLVVEIGEANQAVLDRGCDGPVSSLDPVVAFPVENALSVY